MSIKLFQGRLKEALMVSSGTDRDNLNILLFIERRDVCAIYVCMLCSCYVSNEMKEDIYLPSSFEVSSLNSYIVI